MHIRYIEKSVAHMFFLAINFREKKGISNRTGRIGYRIHVILGLRFFYCTSAFNISFNDSLFDEE